MSTQGNGSGGSDSPRPRTSGYGPPSGAGDDFGLPPAGPTGPPEFRPGPPPGPGFPGPPPERPRLPVGLVVGMVVGVLVAAVAVGGILIVSRDNRTPGPARTIAGATPTASSASASPAAPRQSPTSRTPSRSPTLAPATPSPSQVPAVVPGWTAVESRELVAYDVPSDWTVEDGSLLVGFQASDGLVIMHNSATYKDDVCPGTGSSSRGRAGLVSAKQPQARQAAPAVSEQWAKVAASDDGGTGASVGTTTVSTVKVAGGSIEATAASTVLTIPHPEACQAPSMTFTAVSFEVRGRVVVFMLYLDQGVADALAQDVAAGVIGSLRPIG